MKNVHKLIPLAGYCLVEPLDEEDQKTSSGLILPEKAKEKPAKGKVLYVGILDSIGFNFIKNNFGDWLISNPPVKKGDIVCFHRWSGQDIKEGDKEYKLVQFKDLMGVYE